MHGLAYMLFHCVGLLPPSTRVRPKFGFGYGYGAETDLTYGFGPVSATAKVHWHKFRPKHYAETPKPPKL